MNLVAVFFIDGVGVVMGPGQNFLTPVGTGQFFVARVGPGQPFMVWVWIWKISTKNVKFFNFFPFGSKNIFGSGQKVPKSKAGWPLIYCESKVSLGLVGSGPISKLECLFTGMEIWTQTDRMKVWCDDHYSIAIPIYWLKVLNLINSKAI